jgi:hypothetical protein
MHCTPAFQGLAIIYLEDVYELRLKIGDTCTSLRGAKVESRTRVGAGCNATTSIDIACIVTARRRINQFDDLRLILPRSTVTGAVDEI